MDVAAAMAQIQACMAAPDTPVEVVMLRASGKKEELVVDQRKLSELLGGQPTVVGAVNVLDVQAVARRDGKGKKNPFKFPEAFESPLKGDVVLFRTAEDASPMAFTVAEYDAWVADGMPNPEDPDEEGADEESGEEGEEGEESEEDEESEEGEDDFDDSDEDLAELAAMPIADLRQACTAMGVDEKGTKEELVARLIEHMDADDDDDDDEEESDDDDEEEDEEIEAKMAAAKKKTKGGKSGTKGAGSGAGPSKTIAKPKKK